MKRKNWMLTIWGNEFPDCIKNLDNLIIAHVQKEITQTGKIHWQAFCQFNCQITKASLKNHFDKNGRCAHLGSDDKNIKTALQGVQYVWGYGPLALSKCIEASERYIIKPNEIIQTPVDDEHMEQWKTLTEPLKTALIWKKNEILFRRIEECFDKRNKHCIRKIIV